MLEQMPDHDPLVLEKIHVAELVIQQKRVSQWKRGPDGKLLVSIDEATMFLPHQEF